MSDERRYGIIREQGEFMEPVFLNDSENKVIFIATENDSSNNNDEE